MTPLDPKAEAALDRIADDPAWAQRAYGPPERSRTDTGYPFSRLAWELAQHASLGPDPVAVGEVRASLRLRSDGKLVTAPGRTSTEALRKLAAKLDFAYRYDMVNDA